MTDRQTYHIPPLTMYGILMIDFPPSTEAGHLNLDERTAPLFTLTLLTPSKPSEERMKVQLNLSTTVTLGKEESGRYKVVAVVERLHKSHCMDYLSAGRGDRCGSE